ncbi:MAG TPA: class I adenylate-forming enzyme family protein [Syntrophomonas sp.]|nr:class I adenylate-forming enzyme family protein [Syntrophomonas sp.]HRW11871.1 class I adenylate-forming enzyme family protein [Syntrophomonas sp.]
MSIIPLQENLMEKWKLPLLTDYIKKWAAITPDNPALVSADTGKSYTYQEFDEMITLYALRLKKMGIKKGDIVVAQWLAWPEFYMLTYACATVGAVMTPLDVRLMGHEVVRDMSKINPVAFFCLGNTPIRDFRDLVKEVQQAVPSVKHYIQYTPGGKEGDFLEGCLNFDEYFAPAALEELKQDSALIESLRQEYDQLGKRDAHIIIFTTGSTGEPKPALICHENTITNNAVFSREVGLYGTDSRYLNSMPTSHVAGTCQGPMTVWFVGGTVVSLSMYNPQAVLGCIQKYRPTWWGGVPTMFRMLWLDPNYASYDLSSLRYILYGGSAVDVPFLEKMSTMAATFGTSLGMTECAGYFTATPRGISLEEMAGQVGQVFPEYAPVTIRQPMNEDGTAGEEMPPGEVGEICVHGPIVFLGYYNNPAATAAAISKEGILYTGDMGYFHDFGSYMGLKFAGRRKFVIKPKGFLVFPDEVTDYISRHPKVAQAQVLGMPHEVFVDGVFAYVQPKPGVELTPGEILEYCKNMAAYKRPIHVELWPVDEPLPATRVGKVNVPALIELAEKVVARLRSEGKWDK